MIPAKNPMKRMVGQVDLINISAVNYQFGVDSNSTLSKGSVFPYPSGKSVHLGTDEPGLHGIENKGYPIRVLILVPMQWSLLPWN